MTVVSPTSHSRRASGIGVESAASTTTVTLRTARTGSWMAPAAGGGVTTSVLGAGQSIVMTTNGSAPLLAEPGGDHFRPARDPGAHDAGGTDPNHPRVAGLPLEARPELAVSLSGDQDSQRVGLSGTQDQT